MTVPLPITAALRHFPGIGPVRLRQLLAAGIDHWQAILDQPAILPPALRDPLREEAERCLAALDADQVRYFVDHFAPEDRWRILTNRPDQVTYFDIETLGLEIDAPITIIACWHQGELRTFLEHENLDEFLDLLDDVRLLVSFNGSSFDIPRILDAFHIPSLPCPHLDLRWSCHHRGWRGGLKQITASRGIERPADLLGADGLWAIRLWFQWRATQDPTLRDQLRRYCAADVLLLPLLADELTGIRVHNPVTLWSHLPPNANIAASPTASGSVPLDSSSTQSTGPTPPAANTANTIEAGGMSEMPGAPRRWRALRPTSARPWGTSRRP